MIENREVWLAAVFEREGGFVNDPHDRGKATNMGITKATLASWRGADVTDEDVQKLGKDEASNIYMARYWQAVRGDQLPSGVDIYTADMAVLQGPGTAARILQGVAKTESDGFVGPLTIEACRKLKPLELLLNLHDARLAHLEGLADWDRYGKGWSNRCRLMCNLAKTKIKSKPALMEAVTSRTVQGAVVGAAASGVALDQQGFSITDLYDWGMQLARAVAPNVAGLPEMLQSIEPQTSAVIEHANQVAATPGPAGHISAAITLVASLYVAWRRIHDWRAGKR